MKRRASDLLKMVSEFANGGLPQRGGFGLPNDDNEGFALSVSTASDLPNSGLPKKANDAISKLRA